MLLLFVLFSVVNFFANDLTTWMLLKYISRYNGWMFLGGGKYDSLLSSLSLASASPNLGRVEVVLQISTTLVISFSIRLEVILLLMLLNITVLQD